MKSNWLILVVFVGLVAIASGWVYQSTSNEASTRAELDIPNNIDYFLNDLNYRVMAEDGGLDYEFQSLHLEHHTITDSSKITTPSLQIYRSDDIWLVDSILGNFEHKQNSLEFSQQVVMQKKGLLPMQIFSESLRFEPDLNLVSSDSSILMTSKNSRIEAEQAVFNLADKIYSLKRTRAVYHHDNS
ncbi:MAG: LPS export ABC transporter protein LptC [Planctomycetota bacterium]|jgi:LPS export ABC transporter protein LptC